MRIEISEQIWGLAGWRYNKVHEIQGVISMTGHIPLNLKKDTIFQLKSATFVVSLKNWPGALR